MKNGKLIIEVQQLSSKILRNKIIFKLFNRIKQYKI